MAADAVDSAAVDAVSSLSPLPRVLSSAFCSLAIRASFCTLYRTLKLTIYLTRTPRYLDAARLLRSHLETGGGGRGGGFSGGRGGAGGGRGGGFGGGRGGAPRGGGRGGAREFYCDSRRSFTSAY